MKRRARAITAVPGAVLFVCMFLPTSPTCSSKVTYPYEAPQFCSPYLLGLIVALAALPIAARTLAILLRAVLYPTLVLIFLVSIAFVDLIPPLTVGGVLLCAALVAVVGFKRADEDVAVRAVFATATVGIGRFGLLVIDRDALYGAHVALAASLAMLLGAILWRRAFVDEAGRADLPVARTVT